VGVEKVVLCVLGGKVVLGVWGKKVVLGVLGEKVVLGVGRVSMLLKILIYRYRHW
jgi:hypothetical protein